MKRLNLDLGQMMRFSKILILLLAFPILLSADTHKFYVSMTKIEHVKDQQSLQIISQIFIDDIEDVLQERYSPDITLATEKETSKDEAFLTKYIKQKLIIKINGEAVDLNYIGREYEVDMVKIYLEGEGIESVESIEITNKVLFELFPEQQNIIHYRSAENKRSMVLEKDNPSEVLNFN